MRMRTARLIYMLVATLLLLLVQGCLSPWGMNQQSEQTRKLEESQATKAVAESDTDMEGPAPITINQGEGSTATIAPPEPTKIKHRQQKSVGTEAGIETSETSWFKQRNPLTLLLMGVGVVVVVYGLGKLWAFIKDTSVGRAARLADDAGKRMVDALKRRMQDESDPDRMEALRDAIIDTEAERDAVYNATVGK